MEKVANTSDSDNNGLTLESVRQSLIRQEDTIIFSLIERAKYPFNSPLYDHESLVSPSMVESIVKDSEALQAKFGRYESPEENPFFPDSLPPLVVPPHNYPQILHPSGASININKTIWDIYFKQLLPLFVPKGDDGNYVPTAACDLQCLQALSRRIHYGKFVAEVKFIDAPEDYGQAIRAQDKDTLMKLLTFVSVEEMVKRRVAKKAMIFGQEVSLNDDDKKGNCKVDPSVVSCLYDKWVMPLTKLVEVEYLLCRLD
ncbi:unnamed protein product [Camellia sinensis]